MKKRALAICMCVCMMLSFCGSVNYKKAEAKATKAAMKFLKGSWITAGNSQSVKVVFTRKYVKFYEIKYKNRKKVKETYTGRQKIISTKKKGKKWHIKVKGGNYYVGCGDTLLNRWWKNGEWQYSFSDSLERDSRKSSTQKKAKKKVSMAQVKNDYLTLYYELQEEAENNGEDAETYYSYIKVPGERIPYLIIKVERQGSLPRIWLKHFSRTKTRKFNASVVLHAGNYIICYKDKGMYGLEVWAYKLKGGKIKLYKNREWIDGNSPKIVIEKFQKWIGKNFKSRRKLVFDEVKWKQG